MDVTTPSPEQIAFLNSVEPWENIKEVALEDNNLTADIRVGANNKVAVGLWGRFKIWISSPRTSFSKEETIKNLQTSFKNYFNARINEMKEEIGGDIGQLSEEGQKFLDTITQQLRSDISEPDRSTSEAIQKAHGESIKALMTLREKYSNLPLAPTFFACGQGGKRFTMIKPAPHIENMVFSGGGEKGKTYGSVYAILTEKNLLKNLKAVAGSSAGAITATCIAAGMDPEAFNRASDSLKFTDLFKSAENAGLHDAVTVSKSSIGFSGSRAVEKINTEITRSMRDFLEAENEDAFGKLSGTDLGLAKQLKENLKNPSYLATFKDLDLLRKMAPEKFKELTITGFDVTTKKEAYYNVANSPTMPIAAAVRASMALPGLFKPVQTSEGNNVVDGGAGSNLPVEALVPGLSNLGEQVPDSFKNKDVNNVFKSHETSNAEAKIHPEDMMKTLVFAFDKKGTFSKFTADTGRARRFIPNMGIRDLISGNTKYRFSDMADKIKLWNAGPNAFNVRHGKLSTVGIFSTPQKIHAAKLQAETRTLEWVAQRQHQATYEIIDEENLPSVMSSMTEAELKVIVSDPQTPLAVLHRANDELVARAKIGTGFKQMVSNPKIPPAFFPQAQNESVMAA